MNSQFSIYSPYPGMPGNFDLPALCRDKPAFTPELELKIARSALKDLSYLYNEKQCEVENLASALETMLVVVQNQEIRIRNLMERNEYFKTPPPSPEKGKTPIGSPIHRM